MNHTRRRRIVTLASIALLLSIVGFLLPSARVPPAAAAVGMTYVVTSTSCTGPGSIVEAIALANANPGEDTIQLVPGLQIDATTCPPISTI